MRFAPRQTARWGPARRRSWRNLSCGRRRSSGRHWAGRGRRRLRNFYCSVIGRGGPWHRWRRRRIRGRKSLTRGRRRLNRRRWGHDRWGHDRWRRIRRVRRRAGARGFARCRGGGLLASVREERDGQQGCRPHHTDTTWQRPKSNVQPWLTSRTVNQTSSDIFSAGS